VGKVAVRHADLPDHITERAGEQPPEDFPFNQWCEHRRVGGVVEQSQHPGDRVEQLGAGPADGDGGCAVRCPRPPLLESDVRY
jgi:hypothetical protein